MCAPAFPPLCSWSHSTCRMGYLCQGLYSRWQDRPLERQAQSTVPLSCCLDHQASHYSCWDLMPLGWSEHSNQLPVQPCVCCRECSALLSCCNQAIAVLCNSCHVYHKSRIEGDHQLLLSAPTPHTSMWFQVFQAAGMGRLPFEGTHSGTMVRRHLQPQAPASPHSPQQPPYPQKMSWPDTAPRLPKGSGHRVVNLVPHPKPPRGSIFWRGP